MGPIATGYIAAATLFLGSNAMAQGASPHSGLIQGDPAEDPNTPTPLALYGTASVGGASGCGVVYKLELTGKEIVLYNFTCGTAGGNPFTRVIADYAGNLYGTASFDGAYGYGVLYKLDRTGKQTVLHAFTGGADGGSPQDGVLLRR